MSYNFEFYYLDLNKVDDFVKKNSIDIANQIWDNRRINKKKYEFEKEIKNNLLNNIYSTFITQRVEPYIYLKFLEMMDIYFSEEKIAEIDSSIQSKYKGKKPPNFPKDIVEANYKKSINKYYKDKQITHSWNSIQSLGLHKDPENLPAYSFLLTINFKLKKPYISKDDEIFYPKDNPISKEKVFKVPFVRASSWKGNLRWMATKLLADKISSGHLTEKEDIFKERSALIRIFGNEKRNVTSFLDRVIAEKFSGNINKEFREYLIGSGHLKSNIEGRKGRLNFYPTYFDNVGLEVINPHDRKTKAGKWPIYFETVPENTNGTLKLFYFPFDLFSKLYDNTERNNALVEINEDIELIKEAIEQLLLNYGFSAKKTSGYGVIDENSFNFEIKGDNIRFKQKSGNMKQFRGLNVGGFWNE